MTKPPPVPDYGREPKAPSSRHPLVAVSGGLVVGAAISAIAWFGLWSVLRMDSTPVAVIAVGGAKLIVAIILIAASARFRFAGIGLLLSIPLGGLIFFGACFNHMSFH